MSNKIEYFKSLKDMYQTEKLAKIPTQSYFNIVPLETKRVYGKFVWHKPNAYTLYNKNFNIFTKLKQGLLYLERNVHFINLPITPEILIGAAGK